MKKGTKHSDATKKRCSEKKKKMFAALSEEEKRKRMIPARKALKSLLDAAGVKNISQIKELNSNKAANIRKTCLKNYGVGNAFQLLWVQERAKKRKKELWADPNSDFSKKWSETSSRVNTELWKQDSHVKKIKKGWGTKPNSLEVRFLKLFPELRYTGNYTFRVITNRGSRFPDFIVLPEESKKVIELNSTYWHDTLLEESREEHERKMLEEYAEVKYTCLVIWEEELRNIEALKSRVSSFISNGSSTTIR